MLALQYSISAGDPYVFRIVSCLLYVGCCLGTWRLASRLLPSRIAILVGLAFAAHPIHVETVALSVAQSEMIVTLAAVVAVILYTVRRGRHSGSLKPKDWALIAVIYAIAASAKENGFVLPGLLLVAELTIVDDVRTARDRFVGLWRGYALLLFVGIALLAIRVTVLGGQLGAPVTADGSIPLGLSGRIFTFFQIVPQWLRLFLWPQHLRTDYGASEFVSSRSFGGSEIIGLAIIVAAALLAWITRRRARVVAFGMLWMAVALLPASNLLAPTAILLAERALFLPSVGFVLVLGGAIAMVSAANERAIFRFSILTPLTLAVLAGIVRSVQRQRDWRDTEAWTMASIRDEPLSWRAQEAYGDLLFKRNRPDQGITAYRSAIELAPTKWNLRNELAMRLRLVQRDEEAIQLFRESLNENADQIIPLAGLPPALIALGRYREARDLADSIIQVAGAPPLMVWLRHVADSALSIGAPAGSIRIGLGHP